jgi:hypothetical protein
MDVSSPQTLGEVAFLSVAAHFRQNREIRPVPRPTLDSRAILGFGRNPSSIAVLRRVLLAFEDPQKNRAPRANRAHLHIFEDQCENRRLAWLMDGPEHPGPATTGPAASEFLLLTLDDECQLAAAAGALNNLYTII